jgi:ribosomal protein L5
VLTRLDTRRGNERRAFLTEARFAELHGDSIENHEGLKKVTRRATSIDGKTIEDIKVKARIAQFDCERGEPVAVLIAWDLLATQGL